MGTNKLTPDESISSLLRILIPESYLQYFDFVRVNNLPGCWEIELEEKPNLIPQVMEGKNGVLDGFCNPISILSHAFSLKKIYLVVKRRRWKEPNTDKHYSNTYDLHPESAKITKEFAAFLKLSIESRPVNLSTVAHLLQLQPKRMYQWYRDVISDYHSDKAAGNFAKHILFQADEQTGEIFKEQVVHIFKPENIGETMTIDEKMIGKKYSVIMSNKSSGKIALLVETMRPPLLQQALKLFGEKLKIIKEICCDMSPMLKKLCSEIIPDVRLIIDKFHVVKHIMDAMQSIRLNEKHNIKAKEKKDIQTPNINGWSDLELLEKSRYLLFKRKSEWDKEENEIMENVFKKFKTIETGFQFCEEIREWYSPQNIGKAKGKMANQLRQWQQRVYDSKSKAFKFIARMFDKHEQDILRYFEKGHTNAIAENINGKIHRFLMCNYGTRDKDFFFYRVQIYFS